MEKSELDIFVIAYPFLLCGEPGSPFFYENLFGREGNRVTIAIKKKSQDGRGRGGGRKTRTRGRAGTPLSDKESVMFFLDAFFSKDSLPGDG